MSALISELLKMKEEASLKLFIRKDEAHAKWEPLEGAALVTLVGVKPGNVPAIFDYVYDFYGYQHTEDFHFSAGRFEVTQKATADNEIMRFRFTARCKYLRTDQPDRMIDDQFVIQAEY